MCKLLQSGQILMGELRQMENNVQQCKERYEKALKEEEKLQKALEKQKAMERIIKVSFILVNHLYLQLQSQLNNLRAEISVLFSKYEQSITSYNYLVEQTVKIKFPGIFDVGC